MDWNGDVYMVKRKPRVYVAGAMSANNILDVFHNLRRGIMAGVQLFFAGYAPFVPHWDFHLLLSAPEKLAREVTPDDFYSYSLAWLEVSDVLLVLPGWEKSYGTKLEIAKAEELGIPIFYSINSLMKHFS
jgi:hypothetical protein